jgi:hypothetical protein
MTSYPCSNASSLSLFHPPTLHDIHFANHIYKITPCHLLSAVPPVIGSATCHQQCHLAVGIATGRPLKGTGLQSPHQQEIFSLLQNVQPHPASYLTGTGFFPGSKVNTRTPSKNEWSSTSNSPRGAHIVERDNFTFSLHTVGL